MRVIGVPSGIGDVSWMYSKLCHIDETIRFEIADGWPYRTREFLQMLPRVAECDYDRQMHYDDILSFENIHGLLKYGLTWNELEDRFPYGRLMLECNRHLEMGRRLEEWLPDLPCNFHYDINTKPIDRVRALELIDEMPKPIIGISAASYRGSEAWKTWGYAEWSPFLKWIANKTGGSVLLMGGFWDDLTHSLAEDGYRDVVGKTSFGTAIELQKELDLYVGFSSGLGIIRTVLSKKTYMMWPEHQQALASSWAPLEMLENGTYGHSIWRDLETTKRHVAAWLKV